MEDTFEGTADKMSKSPISPIQIIKKAEKQMNREKIVSAGKQYAPTLYTVLVNEDDDQRLFGFYPTLAGEIETRLAATAAENGLAIDGAPLVRFIVDENLKHGKVEVIAEIVSGPIIEQLRAEEFQRYGMPVKQNYSPYGASNESYNNKPSYGQPYQHDAEQSSYGQQGGYDCYDAYAQQGGYNQTNYEQSANYDQQGYGDSNSYQANDYGYNDTYNQTNAYNHEGYDDSNRDPFAPNPAYAASLDAASGGAVGVASAAAQARPNAKPPLPYVPEEEIDYSADYGEYTFDSRNFEDYRKEQETPQRNIPSYDEYHEPQDAYAHPAYQQDVYQQDAYQQDSYAQENYNPYAQHNLDAEDNAVYQQSNYQQAFDMNSIPSPHDSYQANNPEQFAADAQPQSWPSYTPEQNRAALQDIPVPDAHPHAAAGFAAPPTAVFVGANATRNGYQQQQTRTATTASLIDTSTNRAYDLSAQRILLGRDSKCTIVVNDVNASRQHAELCYEPQGVWVITDLGSTNKTLVNGQPVMRRGLQHGDRITLGLTDFIFTLR